MKNLPLILSIGAAVLIIGGAAMFSTNSDKSAPVAQNIYMEGEKQIVEIDAKGGFSPQVSTAKAGVPTTLRVKTNSTYDCSAGVRIQKLGVSENLDATGVRDIDVSPESAQGTLSGTCAMGMYNFSVNFM